jgi:hypothetical protein
VSFKIADAYVAVVADDTGLPADLRSKIEAATDGLEASIGLGLSDSAPEDFRADLDSALLLTTEDLEAHVGMGLSADAVEDLDADVKAGIDLVQDNNKIKVSVDPKSAQEAGEGMSNMLLATIGAGLALGPGALATGMAAATAAVTADVLKSNIVIAADYKQLGTDGANAIKTATAPLTGDLNDALTNLDGSIKTLQPDLDTLFAGVGPDIGEFETGAVNLATNALPGISTALNTSHADVAGFANGLAPLGSGISDFFTGVTRDSTTTSLGLQSVMGTLGSAVGTAGTIVGSASSAISTDLLAIDPVLNVVSGSLRAIADPATVGGLLGAFGAMKLAPSISSGLGGASSGLLSLSDHAGVASGALLKSSSALDTMSGVMGGPWGIAIGAGMGLLSGFAGMLINAQHATDALALSQTDLQKAIAQDGGNAGSATAALVAQTATQDGLASSAKAAGVSLATWTSAVVGNKAAQAEVTAASQQTSAAAQKQADAVTSTATATGKWNSDLQTASQAMAAVPYDKTVAQQTQMLASMQAMNGQIVADINQQELLNQATISLNNTTAIFNATLDAARTAAQLQYQTAAQSSVALLGLGDNQSTLNMQLVNSESAYATATGAAGAYNTALTSLNGTQMSMDQAQNTMAQDLLNASTSFKANKYSMDDSTQAGINNRTALTNAATAITALGTQTYQATGDMNTANGVIQQQIDAFVKATGATGQNKVAIEQYLEQIAKIPPNVPTNATANTATAAAALAKLQGQLDELSKGVNINVTNGGGGRILSGYAEGGSPRAGETAIVGEDGPEIVTFGANATVIPNDRIPTIGGSSGAGSSVGGNTIYIGSISIPMTGIADFTDPNSLDVTARRMAINIGNALAQVTNSRVGAYA